MSGFVDEISQKSGQPVSACYQCQKCSSGCPSMPWYEWPNHAIVRKVMLGHKDELLKSHALWMCVACETCGTRCPNNIHISRIMDAMRQIALKEGIAPSEPKVTAFHQSFVGSVKKYGKVHELSMLVNYKLKTKDFFTDVGSGISLFLKGKIPLMASKVSDKPKVDKIFADAADKS